MMLSHVLTHCGAGELTKRSIRGDAVWDKLLFGGACHHTAGGRREYELPAF